MIWERISVKSVSFNFEADSRMGGILTSLRHSLYMIYLLYYNLHVEINKYMYDNTLFENLIESMIKHKLISFYY